MPFKMVLYQWFILRLKYGYSMKKTRICIYPKDIQLITGRSERYGRKLLNDIKDYFDKEPHQFVTIEEFSEYSGIEIEKIKLYIT